MQWRVKVEGLSKEFRLPHERHVSLKQAALNFRRRTFERLEVLKDIDFEVADGEFFGIIGRNGSGKSTLLKLLARIYQPTSGRVHVRGNLTPFIELGVGFNAELTGRENIFLNGIILGLTREQVKTRFDEIVSFAELEQFIDQKLKNYSSGMQVRLAFSIAIQAHSEILLIDEVLAVGDISFQQKCYDVFSSLKAEGRTVIFVSHDLANVERFCDRVLILDRARQVGIGRARDMILQYGALMAGEEMAKAAEASHEVGRSGTGDVRIENVELVDDQGHRIGSVAEGEPIKLRTHFTAKRKLENVVFGISVNTAEGVALLSPNTKESSFAIDVLEGSGYVDAIFPVNPLAPGKYVVVAGFFDHTTTLAYDYVEDVLSFKIGGVNRYGKVHVEPEWRLCSDPGRPQSRQF